MENYTLDFYQALKEMIENERWIRGNEFASGIYMKLDRNGQMIMVDVNRLGSEAPFPFMKGLAKQKFRLITVATIKELSY